MSEQANNLSNLIMNFRDSAIAVPLILRDKGQQDASEGSSINFNRHFNPELAKESNYFGSLEAFLSCVEKHSGKGLTEGEQEKVCGKEFKQMRLHAFNNQLFYHNVGKSQFQYELALQKHETPY